MRIEVWSDVVCPWCYIGKRRLESALAGFPHEVEVVWRSFQLDPGAPPIATESIADALGRKYGGGAAAGEQMIARVSGVAAEVGLAFDYAAAQRGNTLDAHRLLHLALETGGPGLQGTLKEALLSSYFLRAESVSDSDALTRVAVSAGLDEVAVKDLLAGDRFTQDVYADIEQAQAYGATGVPFYVVDSKYGVSGAQPTEVFAQVLDRAWADSHPVLDLVGGESLDGQVCSPDGCPT